MITQVEFNREASSWPSFKPQTTIVCKDCEWTWDWYWHHQVDFPKQGYLSLATPYYRRLEFAPSAEEFDLAHLEDNEVETDAHCWAPIRSADPDLFVWKIYILWSATWRVPVAYFSVKKNDGRPASWDEVHNFLSSHTSSTEIHPMSIKITMEFHPFSGEPCFMLHPCHTAEIMATINMHSITCSREPNSCEGFDMLLHLGRGEKDDNGTQNYLLSWLTAIAPALGIAVSPSFFSDYTKFRSPLNQALRKEII